MPSMDDDLFLGIKGHVVRVRKSDGAEVWRTKLKLADLTTVSVEPPDTVYASCNGVIFALSASTGNILWQNELPRLGLGPCLISHSE